MNVNVKKKIHVSRDPQMLLAARAAIFISFSYY